MVIIVEYKVQVVLLIAWLLLLAPTSSLIIRGGLTAYGIDPSAHHRNISGDAGWIDQYGAQGRELRLATVTSLPSSLIQTFSFAASGSATSSYRPSSFHINVDAVLLDDSGLAKEAQDAAGVAFAVCSESDMERIELTERDWWNPAWWNMRGLDGSVPQHQYCSHLEIVQSCDFYHEITPQPTPQTTQTNDPDFPSKGRGWEYHWSLSINSIGASADTNEVAVGGKYHFLLLNCRSLSLQFNDLTLVMQNSQGVHLQSGEIPLLSLGLPAAFFTSMLLLLALIFNAFTKGRSPRDICKGLLAFNVQLSSRRRAAPFKPSLDLVRRPLVFKILLVSVLWHTLTTGSEWLSLNALSIRGYLAGPSSPSNVELSSTSSAALPGFVYPFMFRIVLGMDMFLLGMVLCLVAKGVNITRGFSASTLSVLHVREWISIVIICSMVFLGRYWHAAYAEGLTADSRLLSFAPPGLWAALLSQLASIGYHMSLILLLKFVTANLSVLLGALNSQLLLLRRVEHRMDLEKTSVWAKQRMLRASATSAVAFALITAVSLVVRLFLAPDKPWVGTSLRIFSVTLVQAVLAFLLRLSPQHVRPSAAETKLMEQSSVRNEEELSLIVSSEPRPMDNATTSPSELSSAEAPKIASQLLILFPPAVQDSSSSALQPYLAFGAAPSSSFFWR
eukprot:TRINITY_DN10704_c0_g1_i1.p1 TRINITY_DN10704_c0_g1~~TRINITY_DN10704_c0_g1_i1.p1  ORF type:complete len:674 (-),score=65.74 TRINITY_DN10704_c0_g1_i1:162-2183(-)